MTTEARCGRCHGSHESHACTVKSLKKINPGGYAIQVEIKCPGQEIIKYSGPATKKRVEAVLAALELHKSN